MLHYSYLDNYDVLFNSVKPCIIILVKRVSFSTAYDVCGVK